MYRGGIRHIGQGRPIGPLIGGLQSEIVRRIRCETPHHECLRPTGRPRFRHARHLRRGSPACLGYRLGGIADIILRGRAGVLIVPRRRPRQGYGITGGIARGQIANGRRWNSVGWSLGLNARDIGQRRPMRFLIGSLQGEIVSHTWKKPRDNKGIRVAGGLWFWFSCGLRRGTPIVICYQRRSITDIVLGGGADASSAPRCRPP